jgi:sec-independent protein translocase protein TatA
MAVGAKIFLQEELKDMGLDNPIHIAFLLILLLLVFGAKRLPEMGRSLGDGMRGFKDALSGEGTNAAAATQTVAVAQPVLPAQPTLAAQPTLPAQPTLAAQPAIVAQPAGVAQPAVVVAAQQLAPVAAVQDAAQPLVQNAPAA